MDAHLLEDAPLHHRHDAAAALGAGMILALPGRALKAPGPLGFREEWPLGLRLDRLESGADAVAQGRAPDGHVLLKPCNRVFVLHGEPFLAYPPFAYRSRWHHDKVARGSSRGDELAVEKPGTALVVSRRARYSER